MKKIYKLLAVVLAMALIIGTVPVSAATTDITIKNPSKALYLDGCRGAKESGKKASYKNYFKVTNVITGYDKETMKVKIASADEDIVTVSNKSLKVFAAGVGKTTVNVKVYKGSAKAANLIKEQDITVTVKRNAVEDDVTYKGITDGATYTAGQTINVSLPKSTDSDKRRIVCKSGDVTIKSNGTNKWKVTFNAAGSVELLAEAYMSSTYKKATVSKPIKVTVKAAEVTPTPTPTAAPTPTPTPVPTISVKQVSLNSFAISGLAAEIKKEDIEFYYMSGDSKITQKGLIYTVSYKDGSATVSLFNGCNFEEGKEYFVEVAGSKAAAFKAVGATIKDITTIKLETSKVKVGESGTLVFKYYNALGIDITSKVASDVASRQTVSVINDKGEETIYTEDVFVAGTSITFYKANKVANIKATVTIGYDEKDYTPITVSGMGTVVSYEDTATGDYKYTVTKDDGIYLRATDSTNNWLSVNEAMCFEALFKYSDGTWKTLSQMGYTVESADLRTIVTIGPSASGGVALAPIQAGTVQLLIKDSKGTPVFAPTITVKEARKATTFTVTTSKQTLNLNGGVGDQVIITATAYDQFGQKVDTATFSAAQLEATKTTTGTLTSTTFAGNKLTINGASIIPVTNPAADGIAIDIKCNDIANCEAKRVIIHVKDIADSGNIYTASNFKFTVEGSQLIDTVLLYGTQDSKPTDVVGTFSVNGFFVEENMGKNLKFAPNALTKASDLGVADGAKELFFTVAKNGTVIDLAAYPNITFVPKGDLEFKPIIAGKKLDSGTYTVSVYYIVAGTTNSNVNLLGTQVINVRDSASDVTFTQKSVKVSGALPSCLGDAFDFFYDGEKVPASCITAADTVASTDNRHVIKSVTLTLPNDEYGSFTVVVPVMEVITVE